MTLDLIRPTISQTVLGFPLNHLVDKVSCFDTPASWNLSLFDLDLFGKNVISNLFSRFTDIGSAAKHALVSHYSHGEVIY